LFQLAQKGYKNRRFAAFLKSLGQNGPQIRILHVILRLDESYCEE